MPGSYVIGIDLGGTNLRVAAYAEGLEFLEVIQLPTRLSEGRDRVVRDIRDAVAALRDRDIGGRTLAGIGVGAPGPLELPEGIVRNPPNLTGWDGFNLRAAIESALGRAIELDNDANVAAFAEQRLGVGGNTVPIRFACSRSAPELEAVLSWTEKSKVGRLGWAERQAILLSKLTKVCLVDVEDSAAWSSMLPQQHCFAWPKR